MKKLTLAAVQMPCENGAVEKNLKRAEAHVANSAGQGAGLVLLPEFLGAGYVYEESIWDAAEPANGPTASWLRKQAREHSIYLGTSFLEADGGDFFNTFVLAGPSGEEAGRVRKNPPAAYEALYTRGVDNPHVIETDLGKISVGICFENQLSAVGREAFFAKADLHLMPHSAPVPKITPYLPAFFMKTYESRLAGLAERYAAALGIPAVMCNKCGPWITPLPGLPFLFQKSRFPGLSSIADSDGRLLARLGDEEGVALAEVRLDPARKAARPPKPLLALAPPVLVFRAIEKISGMVYRNNPRRKQKALDVSRGGFRKA